MKIDLTELFNGIVSKKDIDYRLDLSNLIYSTYNPIKNAVVVKGSVFSKADVVYLDIDVSFDFSGFCDRCAEDVKKSFDFKVKRIVVEKLENEKDDDDYIVIINRELDLDELVGEEVSLSLPSKILCKEDCKGLCPKCGANLNVKKCDCKSDVDPRMAALLQLLDEE
ncbi:MAG: YceD family protein [Eubacterium sp.]